MYTNTTNNVADRQAFLTKARWQYRQLFENFSDAPDAFDSFQDFVKASASHYGASSSAPP